MNKRGVWLASVWVVGMCLVALPCYGQATLSLELASDPAASEVELAVGDTMSVRLVLDIPEGTQVITLDAIVDLLAIEPADGDEVVAIVGFVDQDTGGLDVLMRGDGVDDTVSEQLPVSLNNYQLVLDELDLPYDETSGVMGPMLLVVDELVLRAEAAGVGNIQFAMGVMAPGGFRLVENPVTGDLEFADLTVTLGMGGSEAPLVVTVVAADGPDDGGMDGGGGDGGGGGGGIGGGDGGTDDVPDRDGDGLSDEDEAEAGTNPNEADSDGDGVFDGAEVDAGSDPLNEDSDDDGLLDGEEQDLMTSPINADSDGDGLNDREERDIETDPNNADSDGDGVNDDIDPLPLDETVTGQVTGGGGGGGRAASGGLCGAGLLPIWTGLFMALGLVSRRRRRVD